MNINHRLRLLLMCSTLLLMSMSYSTAQSLKPVDLKCEYASNPLGIDAVNPRLSWILEGTRQGTRNLGQTAYRILVASDPAILSDGRGDIWDTGKVISGQSIHVRYGGNPLESRNRYFWKVQIWDRDGTASESGESAWWEMGLLSASDWHAEWISAPKVYNWGELDRVRKDKDWTDRSMQVDPSPFMRKTLTLSKEIKSARAYVSGLGYYELYINGSKIGDHVLDPGVTSYHRSVLYVTYDVTASLRNGENALGVILGTGWYDLHAYAVWGFNKAPWRARPALLCQMEIEYRDGSRETVASDGSWKVARGPIVFDSIRNGEIYDARLEMPGWNSPGFEDTLWNMVEPADGPKGILRAQMLPPVKVMKVLQPVKITEPKPGVYIAHFGENITGWGRITVSGSAGTEIIMKYSEKLYDDGTVDNREVARFTRQWEVQTDRYILKGGGTEEWQPRFSYQGFQYIELHGFPGRPSRENIAACVVHTSFERRGQFACSNEVINSIQDMCTRSYTNNYHSYPTDCPHREKLGWTAESHLGAEQGMYNFNPQTAYLKWLNDMKDTQLANGKFPGIVPTSGWGYSLEFMKQPQGFGPSWDGAYILIPWYLYLFSGDADVLAAHYDGMKKYLEWTASESDNFIIRFGLGDWTPVKTKAPVEVTTTGYFLSHAKIMTKVAAILGKDADRRSFDELARNITRSYNREFFNAEKGIYADGSQTALACALFHGFVEPEHLERVARNLAAKIRENDGLIDTGQFGAKCILPALAENGYPDIAYGLASETRYPSWGEWSSRGATTIWEHWDGSQSLNHTAYGTITVWFYKYLAGIQPDPDSPGFRHIIIKPEIVNGLDWAKGEYDSMYGKIISHWQKDGNTVNLNVIIPPNTAADIFIPAAEGVSVTESGSPVENVPAIRIIGQEAGRLRIQAGSGEYRFQFRMPR